MFGNGKISNERKNLTRLAGEFLVASRLTRRGYTVSLQWGTTIGYDILVFDKAEHVAFLRGKDFRLPQRAVASAEEICDPREGRNQRAAAVHLLRRSHPAQPRPRCLRLPVRDRRSGSPLPLLGQILEITNVSV